MTPSWNSHFPPICSQIHDFTRSKYHIMVRCRNFRNVYTVKYLASKYRSTITVTFFLNLIIFIFSFTSARAFLLDIFVGPRSLRCHIHQYLTFIFTQINILTFYTLVFSQYDFVDHRLAQGTRCLSALVGNVTCIYFHTHRHFFLSAFM